MALPAGLEYRPLRTGLEAWRSWYPALQLASLKKRTLPGVSLVTYQLLFEYCAQVWQRTNVSRRTRPASGFTITAGAGRLFIRNISPGNRPAPPRRGGHDALPVSVRPVDPHSVLSGSAASLGRVDAVLFT
jgi:hypothetical protein